MSEEIQFLKNSLHDTGNEPCHSAQLMSQGLRPQIASTNTPDQAKSFTTPCIQSTSRSRCSCVSAGPQGISTPSALPHALTRPWRTMSWSGGCWCGGNPSIIDQLQCIGSWNVRIATIDHTVELKISQYVQQKLKQDTLQTCRANRSNRAGGLG